MFAKDIMTTEVLWIQKVRLKAKNKVPAPTATKSARIPLRVFFDLSLINRLTILQITGGIKTCWA